MARYEQDYGRDFGRWRQQGSPPLGGMRSDGWGGSGDWRSFAGEEGWYGEGYEGMPGSGYDSGLRGENRHSSLGGRWGSYGGGRYGGYQGGDFGGYGSDFRQREAGFGGRGRDWGYGRDSGYGREAGYGRDVGFSEGWDDSYGGGWNQGERFGTTRAAEIMTENPQTVTPDVSISEVAQKMRDMDVGIIPVIDSSEGRRLRGVITDRDIAIRAVAEGKDGNAKVSDCMTSHVRAVNKNDSVRDVMRVMQEEQVRRVPVTDREGRLVGIIAQADLAVDYGAEDPRREREVGQTLERISEPAQPQTRGMRAAGRDTDNQQQGEKGPGRGAGRSSRSRDTENP